MATLNFELRQSQSNRSKQHDLYMIMLRYTHQSKSKYFFSKKSINKSHWDKSLQKVKSDYPSHKSFNLHLAQFKSQIEDIVNLALQQGITPSSDYVKRKYVESKDKKLQRLSFWQFIDRHMIHCKVKLHKNTIRSYNNCINNLREFENKCDYQLRWDTINIEFYHQFLDYYINNKQLSINGFGKIVKVLKSFLNEATDQGHNSSKAYKSKSFKTLSEEVDNIYLCEQELDTILSLELTHDIKLDKVRDLFLVSCYTGLRFSDLNKVRSNNIQDEVLRLRTEKTGELVAIPILPITKQILRKYNNNLPKAYSNQKTNQYLKQIAKLAGLNQIISIYRNSNQGRVVQHIPKWKRVCTHTARRSFATNMHIKGIPSMVIMKITGHKTEQSFMKYIRINKEENAILFLKNWEKSA